RCGPRGGWGSGLRAAAPLPRMTKWEYATVPLLVHATKQILDNWGDDGWELVAVVPGPNPEQLVAYMKRPQERRARVNLRVPARRTRGAERGIAPRCGFPAARLC